MDEVKELQNLKGGLEEPELVEWLWQGKRNCVNRNWSWVFKDRQDSGSQEEKRVNTLQSAWAVKKRATSIRCGFFSSKNEPVS